jgi:transcription initiation factor TFIIB
MDGKSVNGLAVAYICLAAILLGFKLLQIDLSNLIGITENTIPNRCKNTLTSFRIRINVKLVVAIVDRQKIHLSVNSVGNSF